MIYVSLHWLIDPPWSVLALASAFECDGIAGGGFGESGLSGEPVCYCCCCRSVVFHTLLKSSFDKSKLSVKSQCSWVFIILKRQLGMMLASSLNATVSDNTTQHVSGNG